MQRRDNNQITTNRRNQDREGKENRQIRATQDTTGVERVSMKVRQHRSFAPTQERLGCAVCKYPSNCAASQGEST